MGESAKVATLTFPTGRTTGETNQRVILSNKKKP